MQTINLSANIENGFANTFEYVVTPNATKSVNTIANNFNSGIHSFSIIGSYGTGKSSFLIALESDLTKERKKPYLANPDIFAKNAEFEILNIVGDYIDFETLLRRKLKIDGNADNILEGLKKYYDKVKSQNKYLLIVIDEFGKILEHAANNPEKELYFLQKFAELVNVPTRNILLLTTLHQNFGAYAKKLTESQKNEWTKVKGRFQEIPFNEPPEILLNLVSKQLQAENKITIGKNAEKLFQLALQTKTVSEGFEKETALNIFPLDPFSAIAITEAIQRYGQNERSLFSFMIAKGESTVQGFSPSDTLTYNLSKVYDYVNYIFYSILKDANADSMRWGEISAAIVRAENISFDTPKQNENAIKIIKALGVFGLFAPQNAVLTEPQMTEYAALAMDITDAKLIINKLKQFKIIRFAEYNQRLKLFQGTDVDLEAEIEKAKISVYYPEDYIDDLAAFFNKRISPAKACYYQKGTPRFFDYEIRKEPVELVPDGDIDGYIELIFSADDDMQERIIQKSANCSNAVIFAFFLNTAKILEHLHNIQVYKYIVKTVLLDSHDDVANKEMKQLIEYENNLLNKEISDSLFSYNQSVLWIYKGEQKTVKSLRDFNTLISDVCDDVYNSTPVMNNELFNRHKLSGQIATARNYLIKALLTRSNEVDLGFPADKFPPEKTIYSSLLKTTGLHNQNGLQDHPTNPDIQTLWDASMEFLKSTTGKPQKLSELVKILSEKPYKIKQGFIDFWLPVFLIVKQNDYALYETETGAYCPKLNEPMFDLIQKKPGKYSVKMFAAEGVNIEFFNQYRKFINLGEEFSITSDKIIETIKPFLFFYNRLNEYTKHTKKFDKKSTMRFRDVLAKAKDPEKTFFEDLPDALGFNKDDGYNTYCDTIRDAVTELRTCYTNLIDRIEARIISELKLQSTDYKEYIKEIHTRLGNVKVHLLTRTQKEFLNHVNMTFEKRDEWYQSICYPVLNHPLDKLRDEEESVMLDEIVFLFRECEKYADITKRVGTKKNVDAYSIDMVTNHGTNIRTQTFVLSAEEKKAASEMEAKIKETLKNDDNNMVICTLLKILDEKMKNQ